MFLVDGEACSGCGGCVDLCPRGAVSIEGRTAVIDGELCEGCGACFAACPRGAVYELSDEAAVASFRSGTPRLRRWEAASAAASPAAAGGGLRSMAAAAAPLLLKLADLALDRLLQRGRSGTSRAWPTVRGTSGGSLAAGRRHRHRRRAP